MRTFLKFLWFYCFILLIPGDSFGQTKTELINAIRKDFQVINADPTLKKKTLENDESMENMTDGGYELSGYYKKDTLVKIYNWIGLSFGNWTKEFYFRKARLFFVYEKFQSFVINDTTDEMDHSNVKTTFEGRYYFNNDKLIEQKTTGERNFEDESTDIVKKWLLEAKEDNRLLSKKK